ncbi:MAG: prepilin-type N-terminal cleavage/methylation domain-containing protein [Methylotenera sp.]|nr:prepilin-type N-terminal cleavage/methylation domain-containing protein [Methylotenera sp.]
MFNKKPLTFQKKFDQLRALPSLPARALCHVFFELLAKVKCSVSHNYLHRHTLNRSGGFTLLELLVVVTLMAIVAGTAMISLDGVDEHAATQIAKSEMVEISKAIRQFKRDTGVYPTPSHPADFSALFSCPAYFSAEQCVFNVDTARGWRGPYMTKQGDGYVDLVAFPLLVDAATIHAKADAFQQYDSIASIVWHTCNNYATCPEPLNSVGRPYLLFDFIDDALTPAINEADFARVVSMGADGKYGGVGADACLPNNAHADGKDDFVLCLK